MLLIFIFLRCGVLLSSATLTGPSINIEDFFAESNCIEEPSEDFFSQHLLEQSAESDLSESIDEVKNYRSQINALAQFHKIQISYDVVNELGLQHEKVFNISLKLGDEIYYGAGKSKKLAREIAAKQAIENTRFAKPSIQVTDLKDDKESFPTVVLNNIGLKHGYKVDYYMYNPLASTRIINLKKIKDKSMFTNLTFWKEVAHLDAVPKSPFHIEVYVLEKSFFGKARTIQEAKHNAASEAIKYLKAEKLDKNSVCTTFGGRDACKKAKKQIESPISKIFEYAQSKRLNLEFNLITQTGPSHKPVFTYECVLGPTTTKGVGKSKKEAKKRSAEEMIQNLPDLETVPEDLSITSEPSKKKKKKSKNIYGYAADAVNNAVEYFSDAMNEDEKMDDERDELEQSKKQLKKNNRWSPKEKLQEVGSALDLNIQFQTMRNSDKGYYSLLNLNLNPKYICFGIGANKEISQERVSLNALKFLYKLDLLEDIDEKELDVKRFSFDNFIWLAKEDSTH